MSEKHSARRVTLQRHILESQRRHPEATGGLSVILTQLAYAGKIFVRALSRAPLAGLLGATGGTNIQGEGTKRLDVFGNETVADSFAGALVADVHRTLLESGIYLYPCDRRHPHGITLSLRTLNHAAAVVFLVSGEAKAEVLRDVLEDGDRLDPLPAQLVVPTNGDLTWMIDRAAASHLTPGTGLP